jgi:hypothetical protein
MDNLLTDTCLKAEDWLQHYRNPVILWSGGKDSTALLHLLIHEVGVKLPCVQWREPWMRDRYELSDYLIREWELDVYDWAPSRVTLTDGTAPDGSHQIDFLKYMQWGQQTACMVAVGTQAPVEGQPWRCGMDVLQRPLGTFAWPWDACFHGQKSADVDPIKGQVPLAMDVRRIPDGPDQLFLLRDWSDNDVWSYLEAAGVPNDDTRYGKDSMGRWDHLADRSRNADYLHVCTACMSRRGETTVWCPKVNAEVNNVSAYLPYEDHAIPEQGFAHKSEDVAGRPIARITDGRVAA